MKMYLKVEASFCIDYVTDVRDGQEFMEYSYRFSQISECTQDNYRSSLLCPRQPAFYFLAFYFFIFLGN